jgi:hypothetical protein
MPDSWEHDKYWPRLALRRRPWTTCRSRSLAADPVPYSVVVFRDPDNIQLELIYMAW